MGHHVVAGGLNRSGSLSSPETVGTPNGLDCGMNGSRDSPDEIMRNGTQGMSVHQGSGNCTFISLISSTQFDIYGDTVETRMKEPTFLGDSLSKDLICLPLLSIY